MQVINLFRDLELQNMKKLDRLLGITNKVRLLGTEFTNFRILEKNLVTVPVKHEASITNLENTKDLCNKSTN